MDAKPLIRGLLLELANGGEFYVQSQHITRAEASTHEEWRITIDTATMKPKPSPREGYTGEVVLKLELRIPADQLTQRGELRIPDSASLPVAESPEDLCLCGHRRANHIYHTGACRPGFVCPSRCGEFARA